MTYPRVCSVGIGAQRSSLIVAGNMIRTQKTTEVKDEGDIAQGQPRKRSSPRTEAQGISSSKGAEKREPTSKTKKQQIEGPGEN